MSNWFKSIFAKIPPGLLRLLVPILASIIAGATAGFITVRAANPGEQPGVVIIVPTEADSAPLVFEGKAERGRPVLYAIAKIRAASIYAKEKELPYTVALQLARSVPDDHVASAVREGKVNLDGLPTVVGGPILDWIKEHPEQFQQIIQIILMLIPLFA